MQKQIKSDSWAFAFNKEDEAKLLNLITSLSDKYLEGKTFIPHVSFFETTECSLAEFDKLIKAIKQRKPFKIKLNKISFEKRLSKTLFIEVETNPEMLEIQKIFEKMFGQRFDFHPHISLIYKDDLDFTEREKLAKSLEFPGEVEVNALLRYTNGAFAKNYTSWKTERIEFS